MTISSALITGIAGQDGYYLYHALQRRFPNVYISGLYRGQDEVRLQQLKNELPDLYLVRGDLTDERSLKRAIDEVRPDAIFNLAAVSNIPLSLVSPRLTYEVNMQGVLNLVTAAREVDPEIRIVQASTSEMYGNSPDVARPLCESSYMLPASPYGIAKLAAHLICREYRVGYGMHVSCAISFNHESPRRPPIFVTRKVTSAAARIALGIDKEVVLGNLDAYRDWGFAGDYVEAFISMIEQPTPDDYVIGTGVSHSVRTLCEVAFSYAGIYNWEEHVLINPTYKRPEDIRRLCADPRKANKVLNWKAETSFEQMIADMVKNDLKLEGGRK